MPNKITVTPEELAAFHLMWDAFPGMARLIGRDHIIIAANQKAIDKGYAPGVCCASLPSATNHRGCLAMRALAEGNGMADNPDGTSIRGWLPVSGRDDVYVHFSLAVPKAGIDD